MISSSNRGEENAVTTEDTGYFETGVLPGEQTIEIICVEQDVRAESVVDVPDSGKTDFSFTVT